MTTSRRAKGATAERSGFAAEEQVAMHYQHLGGKVLASRYKAAGAEIDLIVEVDGQIVFVEVKRAATHAVAAERIGAAQQRRILRAAEVFLETRPMGSNTPSRIDAALVDGKGIIHIIENAFGL